MACGVQHDRNVECVYQVAVIAEICERRRLGKFQRIEPALSVAVPLGQPAWTLGKTLASEPAARDRQRGEAGQDAPLPHRLPLLSPLLLGARMTPERDWSVARRHGRFLPLHPRGLQVRARPQQARQSGRAALKQHRGSAEAWGPPMAPFSSSSWKSDCSCRAHLRRWAGVSLPGGAQASLRIFNSFSLRSLPSFFPSTLNI